MELRQLQYLVAVARHRHFTRAAEELYVTQSALSQQIRRLEEELGLALLRRTPQGVEVTPAGADLVERAQAILAGVALARTAMDEHAGVLRGVVRVAATASDALHLPEALADFHREHPGIQIALRQGSAAEVVALVQKGAADLAVTGFSEAGATPAGVEVTPLADEPLRVIAAAGDPLVETGGATIADLRGRPLILAEPGTALRETVIAACQAAGFSPVPRFEVGDPATVRFLARSGLGVSVVPVSWLQVPGAPVGIATIAEPAPRHRLALLTPTAGPSPAGRLLHDRLRATLGDRG